MITITLPEWVNYWITIASFAYLINLGCRFYLWYLKRQFKKEFGIDYESEK